MRKKERKGCGKDLGKAEARVGTFTFFFTDETGSRWMPRGVWSCLSPNLVFVGLSRCRYHHRLPRPSCTHSHHGPSRIRSQSAGNSDATVCWAGGKAGRSSHLRENFGKEKEWNKEEMHEAILLVFHPPASACTEGWSWVLRSCACMVSTTLLNLRLGPNWKKKKKKRRWTWVDTRHFYLTHTLNTQ